MLCYVVLSSAIICYVVMLCYAVLCCVIYVMLYYYIILCYGMLCYVMLCYVMLCYIMLCCYAMLCCAVLCYVMLYCIIILYYIILYYIISFVLSLAPVHSLPTTVEGRWNTNAVWSVPTWRQLSTLPSPGRFPYRQLLLSETEIRFVFCCEKCVVFPITQHISEQ